MTNKERYHYRKDNGLCVRCGKPMDKESEGRTSCYVCRNNNVLSAMKHYADLKAEHRCVQCGKTLDKGDFGVRCDACAKKNVKQKRKWREKQLKAVFEKFRKSKNALSKSIGAEKERTSLK